MTSKSNIFIFLLALINLFYSCSSSNGTNCQDHFIDNEKGNTIMYETCGFGEAIIFIHAKGLDHSMWQKQITHFSNENRVISYDLRGHGESKYAVNSTPEIDDLHRIIVREGLEKLTLVGCSLGAIIALDYTIQYPEKIQNLILVSPGLLGFQEKDDTYYDQISDHSSLVQNGNVEAIKESLIKMNALGRRKSLPNASIAEYVDVSLDAFIRTGNHLRIPRIVERQPLSQLSNIEAKTLLMYGSQDYQYIRNNAQKLADNIVDSEVVEMVGVGHLINLEQPKKFNKTLESFLGK